MRFIKPVLLIASRCLQCNCVTIEEPRLSIRSLSTLPCLSAGCCCQNNEGASGYPMLPPKTSKPERVAGHTPKIGDSMSSCAYRYPSLEHNRESKQWTDLASGPERRLVEEVSFVIRSGWGTGVAGLASKSLGCVEPRNSTLGALERTSWIDASTCQEQSAKLQRVSRS